MAIEIKITNRGTKLNRAGKVISAVAKLLGRDVEATIYDGFKTSCNSFMVLENVKASELVPLKKEIKKAVGDYYTCMYVKDPDAYATFLLKDATVRDWQNVTLKSKVRH